MVANNRKAVQVLVAACLMLLLAGCKETSLYSGLSEQEANEIVALLHRAGLNASKATGKEDTFVVTTDTDNFANAVQLLRANGLPRQEFDNLGKVFKDQSFVTSSTAQRARYIHALSQEISHTISSIDGVVLARVHLSVPEKDPLADAMPRSSASVFVKHRHDVDLSQYVGQIKALVVNGLENLQYENVTVALFEAEPQQNMMNSSPLIAQGGRARSPAVTQMGAGLIFPLALFLLASAVGIGLHWRQRNATKSSGKQK